MEEDYVVFTGLSGVREFDTTFIIASCNNDFERLEHLYRRLRERNFKLQDEHSKLKNTRVVRLFKWLKLI